MKMEDKLIEEYRNRSVEYRLPLPEAGRGWKLRSLRLLLKFVASLIVGWRQQCLFWQF